MIIHNQNLLELSTSEPGNPLKQWGISRSIGVNAWDCNIIVSKSEFQSRYYIPFGATILGKGMKPLILPAMG